MNEAGAIAREQNARIQGLERENRMLRGNVTRFEAAQRKWEDEKARLEKENKKQEKEIGELEEKLALALFRQFGKHIERYMDEKQPLLFEGGEKSAPPEIPLEEKEKVIVSYERRKRGRRKLDEKIPRRDTYIDLSEAEKQCGSGEELVSIGEDIVERLHMIPQQVYVERIHIKKYVRRCGEERRSAIITGKVPANIMPGSIATAGLLASIFTQKYGDYVPYYRQEGAFRRIGADISRQNMANWQQKVCEKLKPLLDLIQAQINKGDVIQMDETGMLVMNEPGRANKKKSYMWLARGGPPGEKAVWYEYHTGRGSEHAIQILTGFEGYVQTDGWSAYITADKELPEVTHVGCWAHARRRFYEALQLKENTEDAREGLAWILRLYLIERELRKKLEGGAVSREAFVAERKVESAPVLEKFHECWANVRRKAGCHIN